METQGKLNVEFPDLELLQRFDVPAQDIPLIPPRIDLPKNSAPRTLKKCLMPAVPATIRLIYLCTSIFLSARMSVSSAAAIRK